MTRRRSPHRARALLGGFTLIEVLVSIVVLAMISTIIYGAFNGMKNTREGVERVNDRYHEGRVAINRMAHELESAYLSMHVPLDLSIQTAKTAFVGKRSAPADRIDFNAFANQRIDRDAHESDQADLSYFGSEDPEHAGVTDLVRRVKTRVDMKPGKGGRVELLATDIDLFQAEYLDPLSGTWQESWDTGQAAGQGFRLPLQVRLTLVLNGGRRHHESGDRSSIRFATSVTLHMSRPLTFAIQ